MEILPDWQIRLGVGSLFDYINEAERAGLVDISPTGAGSFVSIRGDREVGVVKWVKVREGGWGGLTTGKESYGFIQSLSHTEDLFYHISEVRAPRQLQSGDEVEFLVVMSPPPLSQVSDGGGTRSRGS